MEVDHLDETQYDVILLGTSLSQTILFSALSRAGKKVLLLDPNANYGSHTASLPIKDFTQYMNTVKEHNNAGFILHNSRDHRSSEDKEEQVPQHADAIELALSKSLDDDSIASFKDSIIIPLAPATLAAKTTSSTADNSLDTPSNITILPTDSYKTIPSIHHPTILSRADLPNYKYTLDLCPQAIFGDSMCVSSLVSSATHEYLEFRSIDHNIWLRSSKQKRSLFGSANTTKTQADAIVNATLLAFAIEYPDAPAVAELQPYTVPCSKAAIFADSSLSLLAKNRLMTVMSVLLHDGKTAHTTQAHLQLYEQYRDQPLDNLLRELGADDLYELLAYGVCQWLGAQPLAMPKSDKPRVTASSLSSSNASTSTSSPLTLTVAAAAETVALHLHSLGKFSSGPMLFPAYGSGELSQAWARSGCVWGGEVVLRAHVLALVAGVDGDASAHALKSAPVPAHVRGVILGSGQLLRAANVVLDRQLWLGSEEHEGKEDQEIEAEEGGHVSEVYVDTNQCGEESRGGVSATACAASEHISASAVFPADTQIITTLHLAAVVEGPLELQGTPLPPMTAFSIAAGDVLIEGVSTGEGEKAATSTTVSAGAGAGASVGAGREGVGVGMGVRGLYLDHTSNQCGAGQSVVYLVTAVTEEEVRKQREQEKEDKENGVEGVRGGGSERAGLAWVRLAPVLRALLGDSEVNAKAQTGVEAVVEAQVEMDTSTDNGIDNIGGGEQGVKPEEERMSESVWARILPPKVLYACAYEATHASSITAGDSTYGCVRLRCGATKAVAQGGGRSKLRETEQKEQEERREIGGVYILTEGGAHQSHVDSHFYAAKAVYDRICGTGTRVSTTAAVTTTTTGVSDAAGTGADVRQYIAFMAPVEVHELPTGDDKTDNKDDEHTDNDNDRSNDAGSQAREVEKDQAVPASVASAPVSNAASTINTTSIATDADTSTSLTQHPESTSTAEATIEGKTEPKTERVVARERDYMLEEADKELEGLEFQLELLDGLDELEGLEL